MKKNNSSGGNIMARGQKRSRTEILTEQLQKKEAEIAKYEEALAKAKEEKKQIKEELKKTQIETLAAEIEKRGLTIEEVFKMIDEISPREEISEPEGMKDEGTSAK